MINTESLLMHSDNRRKCLMYFYIYVHLDKAKIATLARLKASSDVKKRLQKRNKFYSGSSVSDRIDSSEQM